MWRAIRDRRVPRRAARARDLARQPEPLCRRRVRRARRRRCAGLASWIGAAGSSGSPPTLPRTPRERCARRSRAWRPCAADARARVLRARVDVFEPLKPGARAADAGREGSLDPQRAFQCWADVRGHLNAGVVDLNANPFLARATRRSAHRLARKDPALLRPLRLLHGDLPDLCRRRRRARQSARADLSDQGSDGDRPRAEKEDVEPIDHCLSCLACMTTCPSGVDYRRLVDHTRAVIETRIRAPAGGPAAARVARLDASLSRPIPRRARASPCSGVRSRRSSRDCRRSVRNSPRCSRWRPKTLARAGGNRGPRRIQGGERAEAAPPGRAAHRLRAGRAGARHQRRDDPVAQSRRRRCGSAATARPAAARCCITWAEGPALAQARANVDAWTREIDNGGLEAIVITASGCGTTIKDYGFMLADDPAYAEKAARSLP